MSLTFADLQSLTSDIIDDPSNGYFTLTILKQRLNLSLRELQKRLISANYDYYSECVYTNTVVNQQAYALPSDFMQTIRLSYIAQGTGASQVEQKILRMTPNQRDMIPDTQGDPAFYYFQRNNLMLKPIPNRIIEMHLEYSYYVADMVNQSDTPDCPQQFSEYIAWLTARDCMVKDGRNIAAVEVKLKEYEEMLKQIAVQRAADGPRMIVTTDTMDWQF